MKLEAMHLRDNRWVVRPEGVCGTCGCLADGTCWDATFVNARSAEEALRKAKVKAKEVKDARARQAAGH